MSTAARYLSRLLFLYFGFVLLALVTLALGLDLLENARDVAGSERTAALAWYGFLRLPAILSQLNPIAALLGALLAIDAIRRHRELVALWSAGVALWRLMYMLIPLALLLSFGQFVIDDRLVPPSTAELRDWGVGPYERQTSAQTGEPFAWLLSGPHVVRLSASAAVEGRIQDITIFRRNEEGILLERLDARSARRETTNWVLVDVIKRDAANAQPQHVAELHWRDPIPLDVLRLATIEPKELPINIIESVVSNRGYGQLSVDLYQTWFHHRIAGTLSPAIMIFLALSLAKGTGRRQGTGRLLISGLAIGFAFFIYDGIVLSIGEAGWLPPWLAAWSPKIVMMCIVALLALK